MVSSLVDIVILFSIYSANIFAHSSFIYISLFTKNTDMTVLYLFLQSPKYMKHYYINNVLVIKFWTK